MSEPDLLLEFLIVAFDAPAQFGNIDKSRKFDVFRQGREPVFGRLLLALGSVSFSSRCAGRTRRRAKLEESGAAVPSRQVMVCHADLGWRNASALTESGRCLRSRRSRFAGRPRPDRRCFAGNGAVPGAHTVVIALMPTA